MSAEYYIRLMLNFRGFCFVSFVFGSNFFVDRGSRKEVDYWDVTGVLSEANPNSRHTVKWGKSIFR